MLYIAIIIAIVAVGLGVWALFSSVDQKRISGIGATELNTQLTSLRSTQALQGQNLKKLSAAGGGLQNILTTTAPGTSTTVSSSAAGLSSWALDTAVTA